MKKRKHLFYKQGKFIEGRRISEQIQQDKNNRQTELVEKINPQTSMGN